ncbi:MAG TPA: glycosyltransferase family 4 protein, partial [Planctomycetaceae bacterium]|nr:glycosyltransferase family 4 protein [Planctomycetaceae bacterium]
AKSPLLQSSGVQTLGGYPLGAASLSGFASSPNASGGAGNRPLRMVHVGPCFARGGAEQHIIALARFLNPRRAYLTKCVVVDANGVDPEVAADLPAPVEVVPLNHLEEAVQDHDIMLHWGLALNEFFPCQRPKVSVYLAHGDGPWTCSLLSGSRHMTDHVVAVSQRVRDVLDPGFETTVILNGIDSARLAHTRSRLDKRRELGFDDHDFVLGYVGRLSHEKRPELLIQALATQPRNVKALIVGWGPLRAGLMELANEYAPGRVIFAKGSSYLGDFYRAMDAFCLLSSQEGFALVALEAMMCGVPLIATPVGAVPEVVQHRVNGLIVSLDGRDFPLAVNELRSHPDWARALGREGQAYADQHGHALRMAQQYEDLLESLWQRTTAL